MLALLCYDETHGAIVRNLVPVKFYSKFYRRFFEVGAEYLDKYGKPAGEHLLDEVQRLIALEPKDEDIYMRIFRSIDELRDGANAEYVLSEAGDFVSFQTLKAGFARGIEALQSGTKEGLIAARRAATESLETSYETFDAGLDLSDTDEFMRCVDAEQVQVFRTGISELDARRVGPARKRLHVLGALYGKGKSWWLTELAKHAFMDRATVLYIPLEMDALEECERIAMNFFGFGKQDEEHQFYRIVKDEDGKMMDLDPESLFAPDLRSSSDQADLRRRAGIFKRRGKFKIKQWPSGKLTMAMLSAWLDVMAAKEGFVPDIVLLDYLKLCKITNPKDLRLELGQLAVDFRGMGQERNFAACTVVQLNRGSLSTEKSTGEQVSEDFSITAHADTFITYNQTEEEERFSTARLFVDKTRNQRGKFNVVISQDYGRGVFCLSSSFVGDDYWDFVKDKRNAES